ncbi:MAG: hypothetical protein WD076_07820 [Parvularculaceae bacterium]
MIRATTLFFAAAALCGCASGSPGKQDTASLQPADGAVVLGPLKASNVPAGQCGMILWSLDENRPAPVFRYIAGKPAEVVIGGALVELVGTEVSGSMAFGVYEHQKFTAPSGITVAVDVRFSLGFDGGVYLERGLIVVESPDGWRTVAPSAGLAGCRSS